MRVGTWWGKQPVRAMHPVTIEPIGTERRAANGLEHYVRTLRATCPRRATCHVRALPTCALPTSCSCTRGAALSCCSVPLAAMRSTAEGVPSSTVGRGTSTTRAQQATGA